MEPQAGQVAGIERDLPLAVDRPSLQVQARAVPQVPELVQRERARAGEHPRVGGDQVLRLLGRDEEALPVDAEVGGVAGPLQLALLADALHRLGQHAAGAVGALVA
jgi:hypothetical protein